MNVVAICIGGLAAVISAIAVRYSASAVRAAKESARSAVRSADFAAAEDRRSRTPNLAIWLSDGAPGTQSIAIYRIRNDGPHDLDSVVISQPLTSDQITYRLSHTGHNQTNAPLGIGPLALNEETRLTLECGGNPVLPDFRVRIRCQAGIDSWELPCLLPPPRTEPAPQVH
jgi:hypothetical protein